MTTPTGKIQFTRKMLYGEAIRYIDRNLPLVSICSGADLTTTRHATILPVITTLTRSQTISCVNAYRSVVRNPTTAQLSRNC